MELEEYISEVIKRRRQDVGISKHEIARRSGISYVHFINAERGMNISVKILGRILGTLGLKLVIVPDEQRPLGEDSTV